MILHILLTVNEQFNIYMLVAMGGNLGYVFDGFFVNWIMLHNMEQQCVKIVCKSEVFSCNLIVLTGSFWLAAPPFGFRDEDRLFACFGISSLIFGFRVRSHSLLIS